MGMGAAAGVMGRLRELLEGADAEAATENWLRLKLAEEFGAEAVAGAGECISAEVDRFLDGLPPLPDAAAAAPGAEAQWKRTAPAAAAAGCGASPKRVKLEPGTCVAPKPEANAGVPPTRDSEAGVPGAGDLGDLRFATLTTFAGKEMLSIREYYQTTDGEMKPGKRGITLTPEQWEALKAGAADVARALESQRTSSAGFELKLSSTRKVTVGTYRGEVRADVREWYRKGEELLPGKKGMSLTASQWTILEKYLGGLQPGGGSGQPSAGAPTKSAAAGQADDERYRVEIGEKRFLRVRMYRGEPMVDIREFYEKDGELKPGFRGTSLRRDQWGVLHKNQARISAAAEAKNTDFALDVPGTRRVTVSTYRSGLYIDIREWYKKSGERKPGKKGISLTVPQWEKCVECAGMVETHVNPPPA